MRRVFGLVTAIVFALSACSKSTTTSSGAGSPSASPSASCAVASLHLLTPGTLTIGTDNPVFNPWFAGDTSPPGSQWKADPNNGTGDPNTNQGYEDQVAYDIAQQLGFANSQVKWVAVPFNNSYKPGPKPFDFYIGQVSYSAARAQAVDFSDGYYNVQQALVANKGNAISHATTFADLKGAKLGVQIGTTSYTYITNNIQPTQQPAVFDNSNDVIQALNNKQIEGYLVDAPDAYVNVLIGEAKNGVVVGQFPTIGDQEHFGLVFEKGNPLVSCVNQAVGTLRSSGTLDSLQTQWLKDITFPVISP